MSTTHSASPARGCESGASEAQEKQYSCKVPPAGPQVKTTMDRELAEALGIVEPVSFSVSVFTATTPAALSKGFRLGGDGELVKCPGGQLVDGIAERRTFASTTDFAALLAALTPANALAYGVAAVEKARILPQTQAAGAPKGDLPVIARTRENFAFPAGPGVLMLDVDPPKDGTAPLTPEQFMAALVKVCPELMQAPAVLTHSASSHVWHGDVQLLGPRGLRLYLLIDDAQDIPRAGGVLFKRFWLAGYGRIELSAAGTMLVRSVVDGSVWTPERLDFAGGAACAAPLEQRRPAPVVFNNDALPLDTRTALPDLNAPEEAEYKRLVDAAKVAAKPEAAKVRAEWIEARVAAGLAERGQSAGSYPDEAAALRETYRAAGEHHVLYGDFILYPENGDPVTVGEVLDNPDRWHNQRFADPLEPGYGNDNRIAWSNLRAAGRPYLFSHAHGGQRYTLVRARQEIRIQPGERVAIINKALELIRLDGSTFDRGGELVQVGDDGAFQPLRLPEVLLLLDRIARWVKWSKTEKDWIPCNAPRDVAEGILAMRGSWGLPKLTAVITAPTMDPATGRIVVEEGLDAGTGLLLARSSPEPWPNIPDRRNRATVKAALAVLTYPFTEFPFCSPLDLGVFLAALLTAPIRPALPTAPATSLTAPVAGSGKSLLARCLAHLGTDTAPAVMAATENDAELRKRLLALGRSGARTLVLDNLTGTFSSDALCAWLTSEVFQDRVLGVSETVSVPTRMLVMLTGNNLTLRGDLCRRVLTCRIDPGVEAPWRRGFALDPAEYCREHRLEMVAAALTVIKAGITVGPKPTDRLASFEVWSDTIRRAVLLVRDRGLMDVEDPVESIAAAYESDPETCKLTALLTAWHAVFADVPTTLADAASRVQFVADTEDPHHDLKLALDEIAGEGGRVNTRKLGHWLKRMSGRICSGLRFERGSLRDGNLTWCVRQPK